MIFPGLLEQVSSNILFGSRYRRFFSWFFLLFGSVWTLIAFAGTGGQYLSLKRAMERGDFKTVEGEVRNFKPMPAAGHAEESFEVAGVPFHYSDYVVTGGFNNTASHGGPIGEGLPVRIAYTGNTILRLEVRRDRMKTDAERTQAIDEGRRDTAQKMKAFREKSPELGFRVIATLVALWLTIHWRHYMRYWSPSDPPYTRRRETIFRIVFLLAFLGASYSLAQTLLTLDLANHDYTFDAIAAAAMLGGFVIFDVVTRRRLRQAAGR